MIAEPTLLTTILYSLGGKKHDNNSINYTSYYIHNEYILHAKLMLSLLFTILFTFQ